MHLFTVFKFKAAIILPEQRVVWGDRYGDIGVQAVQPRIQMETDGDKQEAPQRRRQRSGWLLWRNQEATQ